MPMTRMAMAGASPLSHTARARRPPARQRTLAVDAKWQRLVPTADARVFARPSVF
jgi:hypothetical protein